MAKTLYFAETRQFIYIVPGDDPLESMSVLAKLRPGKRIKILAKCPVLPIPTLPDEVPTIFVDP